MNKNFVTIQTIASPLSASIRPPGSKSITNRAVLAAALAKGVSVLNGVLDSEDTNVMRDALGKLGVAFDDSGTNVLTVRGRGNGNDSQTNSCDIYVANSGTTARFLTAALAFLDGDYYLYGKERMHERPIGDLLDALRKWDAAIDCKQRDGFPPLQIHGTSSNSRNNAATVDTTIAGTISSQFLSALLLASPLATRETRRVISVTSPLVSIPYVKMTLAVMEAFGVTALATDAYDWFEIPRGSSYNSTNYTIEPDASAASYFLAAAAVAGGAMTVEGLSHGSLQGDVRFADCLAAMGCDLHWHSNSITIVRPPECKLHGITVNMNEISDTAQTLGVVALFADTPTTITDIAHVRHKETDRIAALATELRKFGVRVDEHEDGLTITPSQSENCEPIEVATYDDHRMAMSFAVAGLKRKGVTIQNPGCTDKTYPKFFEDFGRVTDRKYV
ncbi:MAG: 3-phosphoshikimate 1-carboxyvinyltransferase [Planctomycetaceae bacterium]|jgi:3-phosphoshikimate 1-carboxyvinyltransferase|nr:3-phosphoshikimate 1-carboxyvinyltransferase [Planctomycetaceae bacterium]